MGLTTMYTGKNNSPQTDLSAAITAVDTVIPVTDITVFPAAPNLATIGDEENAEVIRYNGISGSTLTGCERGFGGTVASVWPSGTVISRQITKYDMDTIQDNIRDLDNRKTDSGHTHDDRYYTEAETDTMLALKAPLASPALTGTPTAPTAEVDTDNTQVATTGFVHRRGLLHVTLQIASAGTTKSYSNAAITSTMRVINCVFGTPANVTSDVTWTTSDGTITLVSTFTGATTVDLDLIETDDTTAIGV